MRRGIDDQALWLDGRTLAYAMPSDSGSDLWSVPADGSESALLVAAALAPAVVR